MARALEAVRDMTEETREEVAVSERRDRDWLDPRFIAQCFMILVAIVGSFVAGERRTSGLESAASNLRETATEIKGQLNSIASSVQTVTTTTATLRAEVTALSRENDEIKRQNELTMSHISVMEKDIARLQAAAQNRRNE